MYKLILIVTFAAIVGLTSGMEFLTPSFSAPTCNGLPETNPGSLVGTAGDDVIIGTPGPDTISGLAGNDTICGLDGNDMLNGGTGDDIIFGDDGDDTIRGNQNNDDLIGGLGIDIIFGGLGSDKCSVDSTDPPTKACELILSPTEWADVINKPLGFADDIDDDVLGGLGCTTDQIAKFDGTQWVCDNQSGNFKSYQKDSTKLGQSKLQISCDPDDLATGGGFSLLSGRGTITSSRPINSDSSPNIGGWQIDISGVNSSSEIMIWIICADVTAPFR